MFTTGAQQSQFLLRIPREIWAKFYENKRADWFTRNSSWDCHLKIRPRGNPMTFRANQFPASFVVAFGISGFMQIAYTQSSANAAFAFVAEPCTCINRPYKGPANQKALLRKHCIKSIVPFARNKHLLRQQHVCSNAKRVSTTKVPSARKRGNIRETMFLQQCFLNNDSSFLETLTSNNDAS